MRDYGNTMNSSATMRLADMAKQKQVCPTYLSPAPRWKRCKDMNLYSKHVGENIIKV